MIKVGHLVKIKSRKDNVIFRVNYIDNNYRLNLSVKQIAEDVNLSEYQIYSMFKKFINMTPIDYTNKFRISMACHL